MKKVISKVVSIVLSAVMMVFSLSGCASSDYRKACALYDAGEYEAAAESFLLVGDY